MESNPPLPSLPGLSRGVSKQLYHAMEVPSRVQLGPVYAIGGYPFRGLRSSLVKQVHSISAIMSVCQRKTGPVHQEEVEKIAGG